MEEEEVKLVPLGALDEHIQTYVSVVGIVVEFSIPSRTAGTDMIMTLKIVDESMKEVTVNVFMPRSVVFPVIRASGDVIFLRTVLVLTYKREPYLLFYWRKSCYSMYNGSDVGFFEPYLPHQPRAVPNIVNIEIDRLRLWRRFAQLGIGPSVYAVASIKDLVNNKYPDLVCKVLHICPGDGQMFLYVWDGTDAPSLNITPMFGELYNSKPLVLNTDFDQLPHTVIELFPQPGTILKVAVDVDDDNVAQHFHFKNRWIKVRNICYQSVDGLWKASSKNLKIRLLKNSDSSVRELARNYRNRVAEKECMPMSYDPLACQLTEIISCKTECKLSTLLGVLAAPVGMMFKCIVRVVGFGPSEDNINFRLTIEDPTTRMHAFTPPVDGVHLFSSIQSKEEFIVKFKKLVGFPENCDECDSLSPPWIPCIITTALANPNDPDGNRAYHLICTKLA